MSHLLPPAGHPVREMFEISDLVEIATHKRFAPTLREAGRSAAASFAADKAGAMSRICFIVMRADDRLQLVSIGRRGGVKVEWDFGGGLCRLTLELDELAA